MLRPVWVAEVKGLSAHLFKWFARVREVDETRRAIRALRVLRVGSVAWEAYGSVDGPVSSTESAS